MMDAAVCEKPINESRSQSNPIFCALDVGDRDKAIELASTLTPHIGGVKVGLELFMANGPTLLEELSGHTELPVFLDVKLHDIPNTVAGAIRSLKTAAPQFVTLHAGGGKAMLEAAAAEAESWSVPPVLLAVTVLTSIGDDDLQSTGIHGDATDQVLRLVELSLSAGVKGIVCSPREVAAVRTRFGEEPTLMVPGIRFDNAAPSDQKRTLSPNDAIAAGADFLVIGRPITQAPDPAGAAMRIKASLGLS